ncbi:hypothetical protein ABIE51_002113 [Lysobacter sp. OAE881]|uniref:hypothetical protein n=1 Tax=Lysobacter TaxID=68 RepID=UPI00178AF260|nr:hypothetical protein [Lysobacter soli]MDG2519383.1 hypothetical protein [Lysobacter soli]
MTAVPQALARDNAGVNANATACDIAALVHRPPGKRLLVRCLVALLIGLRGDIGRGGLVPCTNGWTVQAPLRRPGQADIRHLRRGGQEAFDAIHCEPREDEPAALDQQRASFLLA